MLLRTYTKYVIMRIWEDESYLDEYDCEVNDITKAQMYDTYEEAESQ